MADNNMNREIPSKFRATLRSSAQSLSPVVMVGHDGITDGVVEALDAALTDHELVKVRFQDFKEMTRDLAVELSSKTASVLVSTTGFTAVFYRFNPEKCGYEKALGKAAAKSAGAKTSGRARSVK